MTADPGRLFSDPARQSGRSVADTVVALEHLRRDGEALILGGTWGARGAPWCARWNLLLEETRDLIFDLAPSQANEVAWPEVVTPDADPESGLAALRRAAIGGRELTLLARQMGGPGALAYVRPTPSESGSTWLSAGQRFEGALEIRRIVEQASRNVLVVDSYLSDDTFLLLHSAAPNVSRALLTDARQVNDSLRVIWSRWAGIWTNPPGECRVADPALLPHGRFLRVDGAWYFFDASLKDFGERPTHHRRLDAADIPGREAEIAAAWVAAPPLEMFSRDEWLAARAAR